MNITELLGTVSFALGGVIILVSVGLFQLIFSSTPTTFDWLILGVALAFMGFVLLGIGLQSIIKSTKTAKKV